MLYKLCKSKSDSMGYASGGTVIERHGSWEKDIEDLTWLIGGAWVPPP